jgi:hypothetical protein
LFNMWQTFQGIGKEKVRKLILISFTV